MIIGFIALLLWFMAASFLCGVAFSDQFMAEVYKRVRKYHESQPKPAESDPERKPSQPFSAAGRVPWPIRRRQLEKEFEADQEAV